MMRFGLSSLLVVVLAIAGACGEKTRSRRGARDATARQPSLPDAVSPVAPIAGKTLRLSATCECQPVPADAILAHEKARETLVRHIDQLNQGLRAVTEKLDLAVPDEAQGRLEKPDVIFARQQRLVCRLDCLLAQFVGATDTLWSYLNVAGRLLDTIRSEAKRLTAPAARRPPGAGLAGLRAQFNAAARTSNQTIGLSLIASRPPDPRLELDQNSFAVHTRRWGKNAQQAIGGFERLWLPLVHPKTPRGPALDRPVRLRVAIARLCQRLARLRSGAEALRCARGKTCAARQTTWKAVQTGARALSDALERAASRLRGAGHRGLTLAQGRELSRRLEQTFSSFRAALTARAGPTPARGR